ncbi:MAG: tetratricopeptide repeat protein [Bacteroidia bacterium]
MRKHLTGMILFLLVSSFAFGQKKALTEIQKMEFDKYFFAGMREKMINNFADAEDNFKKALEIDPSNANTQFQLSNVLLQQKKVAEAEIINEKAVLLEPKNEWYTRQLVDIYKYTRNYKKAEKLLQSHYKNTKNSEVLYELAMIQLMDENPNAALKSFNLYEKNVGVNEIVIRQKEQVYLKQGKLKKAIQEVEKLIRAYPEKQEYRGALADLYMSAGKENEALAIYESILKIEPNNGYASFALSDHYRIKNNKEKSLFYLLKGLRSPADIKTKLNILTQTIPSNFFEPKHHETCMQLVDTFMAANSSDPTPYILKGDLLMQEKKLEEARNSYLIATEQPNGGLLSWEQVLQCDQLMQRFDLMNTDCKKVNDLFPIYAPAYLFRSLSSMQLKDYEDAINASLKGAEIADEDELKSQLLSTLGDAAHYAKKFRLCDSAYDEALILNPENPYALNNYAYFLSLRKDRLEKADSMSRKSMILDPNNASYLDTYGWIQFQKKQYDEAKTYIERSLEMSPNNAEVIEHLGDVLFMLDKKEDALLKWKESKELGNASEGLEKKIKNKKFD